MAAIVDTRAAKRAPLSALERRALAERHAEAVKLLPSTADVHERYRILLFVVAPPAAILERQLERFRAEDDAELERR